ncbi:MAG: UDP-glucose/GDP-mannose dehydrogenase family protein [Candidatus Thermoplasmatota archaeon]|jgi:UDPglucose 6-dehydrogenase|nr:UDP-glucose/GDP-mannose dehydrogenase family protein [Candidatus Thermoplasmatota archaeon]MCL5785463.1 UDP-glucose/GDP-mannose dehydrogenase family protein [Candidatus Thermoplasmatota archaeon]
MKIGVVGLGYVGSVTVAVLAEAGNEIIAVDVDRDKIESLSRGEPPIYEPGLKEALTRNRENIHFSSSFEQLRGSAACFLCVPTPNRGGKIDLSYVVSASESVSSVDANTVIVIKSTVLPGTASMVRERAGMRVVSNPEFTREGSAVEDTRHPDRIVVGSAGAPEAQLVENIWKFTGSPVLRTNNENAELIKYASNAFLSIKISFINEISNLCERIPGGDVEVVAKGMGMDRRIAPYFLKAGIGYGGSCFPKDTEALLSFAQEKGDPLKIVEASRMVNEGRISRFLDMVKRAEPPSNATDISVLGVAFKDSTDDIRESQAAKLVRALIPLYRSVYFYDPVVKTFEGATRCGSLEECIQQSRTVVIATEWPEFGRLSTMGFTGNVIDGRRILSPDISEKFYAVGLNHA